MSWTSFCTPSPVPRRQHYLAARFKIDICFHHPPGNIIGGKAQSFISEFQTLDKISETPLFILPFSFTQNFPNPLMRTSSPDSRVCFMVSKKDSKTAVASCLFNAAFFEICPINPRPPFSDFHLTLSPKRFCLHEDAAVPFSVQPFFSANSRIVHRFRPSGGSEHAMAKSLASNSPPN